MDMFSSCKALEHMHSILQMGCTCTYAGIFTQLMKLSLYENLLSHQTIPALYSCK